MTSEIRANTIKNRVGLGTIEYSNTGPVISGVTTALNFKTGTSNLHSTGLNIFDLDVDGHTNLDNVSIAGVTTMSGNLTISNTDPRIIFVDTNNNPDFTLHANGGVMQVENSGSGTQVKLESSGSTRLFGNVIANKDLDVDGHTNLDNVSIAGVTTFNGGSTFGSSINLGGELNFTGNGHKYIDVATLNGGNTLTIRHQDGGSYETAAYFDANGGAFLQFNGNTRFQTTNAGATVHGDLTATNDVIITGSGEFYGFDNSKIVLGHGRDLQIYHDGTDSFIDNNSGSLKIYGVGSNGFDVHIQARSDEEGIKLLNFHWHS